MYVNPGELKKSIQIIQYLTTGMNENGFPQKDEVIVRKCRAKVTNNSGSEILKSNSEFSDAKKRFLIRYTDTEINTDMFIRYRGKDHDIKYVNTYGDNKEYLEIWTELSERV